MRPIDAFPPHVQAFAAMMKARGEAEGTLQAHEFIAGIRQPLTPGLKAIILATFEAAFASGSLFGLETAIKICTENPNGLKAPMEGGQGPLSEGGTGGG